MRLYTFYPIADDGTQLSENALAFESDETAVAHADQIRRDHSACLEVVVWEGQRLVFTLTGPRPDF
jgi:hypothetical protein